LRGIFPLTSLALIFAFLHFYAPANFATAPPYVSLPANQSQPRSENIPQLQAQTDAGDPAAQLKLARAYDSGNSREP
jgi:hypothetical protein